MRRTLLSLVATIVFPVAAFAQTKVVDLTAEFIRNGVVVDELVVSQISDIVLLRGKTNDKSKAEDAFRIAGVLGYRRVANLIVVTDDVTADAAIVYTGRRRLELEPSLEGCKFRVSSTSGVIRLTGTIVRQGQADLAVEILRRIDGVKEIRQELKQL